MLPVPKQAHVNVWHDVFLTRSQPRDPAVMTHDLKLLGMEPSSDSKLCTERGTRLRHFGHWVSRPPCHQLPGPHSCYEYVKDREHTAFAEVETPPPAPRLITPRPLIDCMSAICKLAWPAAAPASSLVPSS